MAFSLLNSVRGYLTPELVNKAAAFLGETPDQVSKTTDAAVPAVLSQLLNRAESGDTHGLLHDAKEAAKCGVLTNPESVLGGGLGSRFPGGWDRIQRMFSGNTSAILGSLANVAGLKVGSVQGLLGMLTTLSLGVLGRHAKEANLVPQTVGTFMTNQREEIEAALPQGLSFSSPVVEPKVAEPVRAKTPPPVPSSGPIRRKGVSFVPLILLIGIGVVAIVWYWNTKGKKTMVQSTVKETPAAAPVPAAPSVRQYTRVQLANGVILNVYEGGVESRLVACLNDAGCVAGKDKWFDFDNINFETGSAKLTAGSTLQVQNIVAILKAYPKAKVKIGGYTDKTGNDAANLKLSQQRADAVLGAIKGAGANPAQLLGAEGYGSQFAKVPATAPDEERRQDRRIAVQLAAK